MKSFFTKGRRDNLAKTLLTLVQIGVAAAVAGDVFIKLSTSAKIIIIAGILALFVLGIIISPPRSDE